MIIVVNDYYNNFQNSSLLRKISKLAISKCHRDGSARAVQAAQRNGVQLPRAPQRLSQKHRSCARSGQLQRRVGLLVRQAMLERKMREGRIINKGRDEITGIKLVKRVKMPRSRL